MHSVEACFVTNLGLQKPQQQAVQVQGTIARDKDKTPIYAVAMHPRVHCEKV